MSVNNIGIIGGGIAGLYLAYRLSRKRIPCTIFEGTSRLGGRIYTHQDPYLGQVEAGAGRFLLSHKHLIRLLKELGLYDKKIPIHNQSRYIPSSGSPLYQVLNNQKGHIEHLVQTVLNSSKKNGTDLRKIVFLDFARQVLTPQEANLLYDSFGYSTELTMMNAYDAIQMIENHLSKRNFYVLGGGLDQVVERLTKILEKSEYVTIYRGRHIDDISVRPQGGGNGVRREGYLIRGHSPASGRVFTKECDICICAVPVPVLRTWSIFNNLGLGLDKIICSPLCRIYSLLETKDPHATEKLAHRFTTNTDIRYYIPMGENVAMISYTDNDYARKWNRIYEKYGSKVLNRELKKELERTVGPIGCMPKHTQVFYWDCGVGYWGVGADSENFDYEPMKGLFICGENVSAKNQQWIEGALDTAELVLKRVI